MNSSAGDLERVLLEQANFFGKDFATILSGISNVSSIACDVGSVQKDLVISGDFIASISFVGMVTGEFIIVISKDTARTLFKDSSSDDEVQDLLTEVLNMAAGSRLKELTKQFHRVTIQAPKVIKGQVRYPMIKNVPMVFRTGQEVFHGHFFIDHMRLDLAESYKDMINDLKKINSDLSVANHQLKQQQTQLVQSEKMASLGMLAAGVAHEINNPLAFVVSNNDVLGSYVDAMRSLLIGYDQMLKLLGSGKSDEAKGELRKISEIRQKEDIDFIVEDTRKLLAESKFGLERIRGIVSGLKRFSRVDDGGIKKIHINEELQNTLLLLQNELKYRCQVETDFKATQPIECLPGEINQVFVNLIINAAQAIKDPSGKVTISTSDDNDAIRVRVADTGCGISKENLEKLFQPFFTTKPVGEGTGLGLAISHGIIQKHGGKIEVTSKLNVGTEFIVRLPLKMAVAA